MDIKVLGIDLAKNIFQFCIWQQVSSPEKLQKKQRSYPCSFQIGQLPTFVVVCQIISGLNPFQPRLLSHHAVYPVALCHCIFNPDEFVKCCSNSSIRPDLAEAPPVSHRVFPEGHLVELVQDGYMRSPAYAISVVTSPWFSYG